MGAQSGTERLRVLNVDDDDTSRYVKSRFLKAGGHEVVEADSGAGALASLATDVPDAAVLDVKLPDMSGFEVARACAGTRAGATSRSCRPPPSR